VTENVDWIKRKKFRVNYKKVENIARNPQYSNWQAAKSLGSPARLCSLGVNELLGFAMRQRGCKLGDLATFSSQQYS
jgi:hypothetical protein